ncbi:MAG: hypothetical protein AB7I27_10805 [Bacteriovoracaceae bacterium]
MEETTSSAPIFKKIDRALFEKIDKFKLTPNYNNLQDFYNTLDEEQQKVFKAFIIFLLFFIPAIFLGTLWYQNNKLKEDLNLRISIVNKASEIIGQNIGLREVGPSVVSMNPIDSSSMMTSRLSNMLSSMSIDLSKIQVTNFNSEMNTETFLKSEADISFNNLSTDELMNIFTAMIQREKFRIQSVDIKRNPDSGLLQGQFHTIHFSSVSSSTEEE